jgi:hypothetical protein
MIEAVYTDYTDNQYVVLKLSTMQVVGFPYERSCDANEAAAKLAIENHHNTYVVFQRDASYRWNEEVKS